MKERSDGATKANSTTRSRPEDSGGILAATGGFIGNAGITLLGSAAGAVLSIANEVLAARFLGVAAYGLYALAMMLAKSGGIIAVFGVTASVMHYLPIHLSRGERQQALGTIVSSLPVPVFAGLAFALTGWLGGNWIASHVLGQPEAGR